MIHLMIHGAGGRMGKSVAQAAAHSEGIEIVTSGYDAVVDFTRPEGTVAIARRCREEGVPLVSGTTGLEPEHLEVLQQAAADIPIVHAPNMSLGVNLLRELVYRAAKALGEAADVEVFEAHHRNKTDAPSGTALALGRAVTDAWGADFDSRAVYDRSRSHQPRESGEIGFQSLRAGDIVGEHQVLLAMPGERLELGHRATDRGIFAQGALQAARWVVGRPPGLYGMNDVLGLKPPHNGD